MPEIEVGDRIKYLDKYKTERVTIIKDAEMVEVYKNDNGKYITILKIERPKYEVIEEKKELLTEGERELLKVMIKYLCAEIGYIKKTDEKVILIKNNGVEIAQIVIRDIVLGFKNLQEDEEYTLEELGLEE